MSGPLPAKMNDDAHPAREQLEQFLAELNALAICLKRETPLQEGRPLPPAARAILELLQRYGPMSVPALARARGTSRQNIQIIANRLAEEGWASTTTNPLHKRSGLVSITADGRATLASGAAAQAEILHALLSATSQAELVSCLELLRRLRQALGAKPAHTPRGRSTPRTPVSEPRAIEPELPVNLL